MGSFERIYELKQESDAMPPASKDLFSKDIDGSVFSYFFRCILDAYEDPHVKVRLEESDLSGTAEEVYQRLNDPKHPVRNALILRGINDRMEDQ